MTNDPHAKSPVEVAAEQAREIIATELSKQNFMWGDMNERADTAKGQLFMAAQAQIEMVRSRAAGASDEEALAIGKVQYPLDWSGFRDYGSEIANLAVAAAYIENEIKRRLLKGESTYRAPRRADQPYDPATGLPKQTV